MQPTVVPNIGSCSRWICDHEASFPTTAMIGTLQTRQTRHCKSNIHASLKMITWWPHDVPVMPSWVHRQTLLLTKYAKFWFSESAHFSLSHTHTQWDFPTLVLDWNNVILFLSHAFETHKSTWFQSQIDQVYSRLSLQGNDEKPFIKVEYLSDTLNEANLSNPCLPCWFKCDIKALQRSPLHAVKYTAQSNQYKRMLGWCRG